MVKLALLLVLLSVASAYITMPWPTPSKTPLSLTMGYGTVKSTGTVFVWYSAFLDDLSRYSQVLPTGGCSKRGPTTATANLHGCTVAANSGYFKFSPSPTFCTGNLVVNSTVPQWLDDTLPMIATTANATLLGALTRAQVTSLGVVHGVSGSALIQLDGRPSAQGLAASAAYIRALRPQAEEVAPRTLLTVDALGAYRLLTIDGVEALNLGVTMPEAAEIVSGGATGFPFASLHAINLDGGGSTTLSAVPGLTPGGTAQVFNRPTDTDVGPITERDVTSVVCFK